MKIHELHITGRKSRKRVGRGDGSGIGTTSGRGDNGQNSRSGGKTSPGFEGGQTSLSKRLPKTRGFKKTPRQWAIIHTDQLNRFSAGSRIDKPALKEHGLLADETSPVKLLHRGDVEGSPEVHVDSASKNARAAIERAGGTITTGWQE